MNETWWWPLKAETCSFNCYTYIHIPKQLCYRLITPFSSYTHTTGMIHPKVIDAFFNRNKNHVAYITTYRTYNACFIILYSFWQFLVQIGLDVHSEIHIRIQWCVNYCSTWTRTGKLINFSRLPSKKFTENLYRGLSSYMQTHTDEQAQWS